MRPTKEFPLYVKDFRGVLIVPDKMTTAELQILDFQIQHAIHIMDETCLTDKPEATDAS